MGLFSRKSKVGLMDVIRCDEPDYLIWKWHPAGTQPGESKRENAIRWGSSLRVKDGEVAVFVYPHWDGSPMEYIEGPFDQILATGNLPILSNLLGLAYDGGTPFQAEVYFINLARIVQVKFGVPFFDVYDPRFADFGVPVAVRGTISFSIQDYQEFIKLHRLNTFDLNDFQTQIRDAVTRYVKDTVANAPAAHNIPLVQIEAKTAQITDAIEYDAGERLKDQFGVVVSSLDIGAIELDKSSDGYAQLMAVTKDLAGATARAEAEAKIKDIAAKQRIEEENYEETLRIQREEAQYAQRKQTQTTHFAAYQTEAQTEVGVAGAEALGKMGGGTGSGGGFDPAAMVAGMAIGGTVGQNIAGTMNQMMGGTTQATPGATPPPIPTAASYHVAVNGQPTSPFDLATLAQMAAAGTLTKDSLVWKAGMENWAKASEVEKLKSIFGTMPPIPTSE